MSELNATNARTDEIQSIEAIFGDLIHMESPSQITVDLNDNAKITITLPENYPESSPPYFELSASSLTEIQKRDLKNTLNEIYLNNIGMPVLYEWITFARTFLDDLESEARAAEQCFVDEATSSDLASSSNLKEPQCTREVMIISGKTLTDRKSTFQSHVAQVFTKNEVELVLSKLKENGKIARATHNMYAYLIEECVNGRIIKHHDCEDDGETGAGTKLLNLLELTKAKNVIVIVTRWYGGIHLGPDRFKHICNLAREILVDNGFSNRT